MQGGALVGRDRELSVLDEAVASAASGVRSALMLTGEPGIGKSRMLEELERRIDAIGGKCAWGRTWEVGLTPAFWPWVQVLSALEENDVRAPSIRNVEASEGAATRLALFDEVVAFLRRRSSTQTIALLFDDVHVADLSSLQLLEWALPLLRGRILVCLAARDADASPAVAALLGRIRRIARPLPLPRLSREDVSVLVPRDADRIFALTEGNPLFALELSSSMEGGSPHLSPLSSVRAVIRDRVANLPEDSSTALRAAAIVGRDFRASVVSDMLSREVASALLPALRLGMVTMTDADRHRFSHALVAEALADELEPSERARLHLRAAQALERRDHGDLSGVAHHLLAAGNLAAEAAVGAAERAAAEAMVHLAFEDAAALLERALAALALARPADRKKRAMLLAAWGEALQHAGAHEPARKLCDEATSIARDLGDGQLFARIALVRGIEHRFGTTDPLLVDALREAERMLDRDDPLRARVLARLASAEQPAREPSVPVTRAMAAIELARPLDRETRLDVMYTATAALIDYVEPRRLEAIHAEVLSLAREKNARPIIVHTLLRLCFTALEGVDREAFERARSTHAAYAESANVLRWKHPVHMLEALRALLDGRFGAAHQAERAAAAIAEETGDRHALTLLALHRLLSAWTRTVPIDPKDAEVGSEVGATHAPFAAWTASLQGDLASAALHLGRTTEVPSDANLIAMYACTAATLGDASACARVWDALAARRGTIVLASMVGFAVQDLPDRLLLILARVLRRWDSLDCDAESAITVCERLGSPVWAARVRADWADALEAKGEVGRAEELRGLVRSEAERLEMPGLLARVAGKQPRPRERPAASSLSIAKSGELWIVAGFGEEVRVKDSRGMQMLARLVEARGRELHALDLSGGTEPIDGGDAGPLLDETARAAYRTRIAELRAERDEAEAMNDAGRRERVDSELAALTAELSRAIGFDGRDRRQGAAVERARTNVQRRVAHAIQQVRSASARLGEHLGATVRTGTYCAYEA